MSTRREFLEGSIAAAALPLVGVAGTGGPLITGLVERLRSRFEWGLIADVQPLYKVILDERFPASVAFANQPRRRGLPLHGICGDITRSGFTTWTRAGNRGPAAIAGLTDPNALFCLDLLARDKGMRVASREEKPGRLVAWVIAPRASARL